MLDVGFGLKSGMKKWGRQEGILDGVAKGFLLDVLNGAEMSKEEKRRSGGIAVGRWSEGA